WPVARSATTPAAASWPTRTPSASSPRHGSRRPRCASPSARKRAPSWSGARLAERAVPARPRCPRLGPRPRPPPRRRRVRHLADVRRRTIRDRRALEAARRRGARARSSGPGPGTRVAATGAWARRALGAHRRRRPAHRDSRHGGLVTPPLATGILPGVTRALVIALARRAGLRVREERVTVARLRRAREIFLTASTIEVLPVVRLDGRAVGGGRPGPATLRLQLAYAGHVAAALRRSR